MEQSVCFGILIRFFHVLFIFTNEVFKFSRVHLAARKTKTSSPEQKKTQQLHCSFSSIMFYNWKNKEFQETLCSKCGSKSMKIFEPTKNQKAPLLYTIKCTACTSTQSRGYFCPLDGHISENKVTIMNKFTQALARTKCKDIFDEERDIYFRKCPICNINIKEDDFLYHMQHECFIFQQAQEKKKLESDALERRMQIHYQSILHSVSGAPVVSFEDEDDGNNDEDVNMDENPLLTQEEAWNEQQRKQSMENLERMEQQRVQYMEFLVEQGEIEPIELIGNQRFTLPPQLPIEGSQNVFFEDMELILKNLGQWLKLPIDLKDFEEVKYVRDMMMASQTQEHTFSVILKKNNFYKEFVDMGKMQKKTFELYFKQSTDNRELLSQVTNWKLSKYHGFDEFGYPWFRKRLSFLAQDVHEFGTTGQFCVDFLKRLETILSVHEDKLQFSKSQDGMDFSHSACFSRISDYCQKINAKPLCFYFYRDDFKVFDYSQIESQSHGGLYFKILNFPNWFEKKVESVNIYSLTKPHCRDVYEEIVKLFNYLWQGVTFGSTKYLPILVIDDGDNPERYAAMMHISWFSNEKPCVCCHTTMQELPFENFMQLNDQMLIHSFSTIFNHFYNYKLSLDAFLQTPSADNLKIFFKNLNLVVKVQKTVLLETGEQFLEKGRLFSDNEAQLMQYFAPNRKRFPKNVMRIQFPVYLKLISFWKGFFPFYFSIPMEPFHTAYNNIKNTLCYLEENKYLDEFMFNQAIQNLNQRKEKKAVRFHSNFHRWHGDQLLELIKDPNTANEFCSCIKDTNERENALKLFVILAFIRNSNDDVIKENLIFQKFSLWQQTITKKFKDYIQPKITYHQVHHLLVQIMFFGASSNWDAKIAEIKNRKIGRKNLLVFSGKEISKQIVHAEVVRENLKMATKCDNFVVPVQFDAQAWMNLVQKW